MGGKEDTEGVKEIQEDEDRKKGENEKWKRERQTDRQTKFRCVELDVY